MLETDKTHPMSSPRPTRTCNRQVSLLKEGQEKRPGIKFVGELMETSVGGTSELKSDMLALDAAPSEGNGLEEIEVRMQVQVGGEEEEGIDGPTQEWCEPRGLGNPPEKALSMLIERRSSSSENGAEDEEGHEIIETKTTKTTRHSSGSSGSSFQHVWWKPRFSYSGILVATLNFGALCFLLWFLLTTFGIVFLDSTITLRKIDMVTSFGPSFGTNSSSARLFQGVGMELFRDSKDAGNLVMVSEGPVKTFFLDTGLGIFNGFIEENGDTLLVGGEECLCNEEMRHGLLSFRCPAGEKGDSCERFCLLSRGSSSLAFVAQTGKITSYRTKNSLGFGVVQMRQYVVSLKQVNNGEGLEVVTETHMSSRSNASTRFLCWQDVAFMLLFVLLVVNIISRSAATPVLAHGILVDNRSLRVRADLAGGVFTSPGLSYLTFLVTVVFTPQIVFSMDGTKHTPTVYGHVLAAAGIASLVCVMMSAVLHGSIMRLRSTGMSVFAMSLISRFLLLDTIQGNAHFQLRDLGQVLVRDCSVMELDLQGNIIQGSEHLVDCNIADGVGLSGLEMYAQVYLEPFLLTLAFLFVFESMVWIFHKLLQPKNKTTMPKFAIPKDRKLGSYEVVAVVSGRGVSVFASAWAAPVRTVFGQFFHASTLVEDNHILWGPLLIRFEYFFIALALSLVMGKRRAVRTMLKHRIYIGVLSTKTKLISARENGSDIPDEVENFDFENMSLAFNGYPVQ